ncbi:MAG: hypothetical protein PHP59_01520 [Methanofollis sp.]|uniref:hypothetical protein n=1 Tax=Methanofollis sp. TaxID=2052835 RepID=UPI002638EB4B|nr:hypothetical protein [Methanofollis sp.]MDD4254033.1 hypothetical protein [Methanofollis sp.]
MIRQIGISAIILAGLVAAVLAGPALDAGENVAIDVGKTVEIPITLTGVDAGISGYNITLALTEPGVAEITDLSFPGWAGLHTAGVVPAETTWMQAVDLGKKAETGEGTALVGTVTIRGEKDGLTGLMIRPVQVQNDRGEDYQVEDLRTEISVGTTGSASSSSSSDGSSVTPLQTGTIASAATPTPESTTALPATPKTPAQVSTTASGTDAVAVTGAAGEPTPKPAPLCPVLLVATLAWVFWLKKRK